VVPSLINNLTTPAVVVPVATIEISSIREPFDPAVKTLTIVPVPSLDVFEALICAIAVAGVAAY
jgi:hypothetical protein